MAAQEFTTEELANEIWKPVVGFEAFYAVSDLGRVKTIGNWFRAKRNHIFSCKPRKKYSTVSLNVGGKRSDFTVHSLVAAAFIGPRPTGYEINHIDTNKNNNRAENLEYVTPKGNMRHAVEHNLVSRGPEHGKLSQAGRANVVHHSITNPECLVRGDTHPNSKLTSDQVREIRRLFALGMGNRVIAPMFGVKHGTISDIRRGRLWRHIT